MRGPIQQRKTTPDQRRLFSGAMPRLALCHRASESSVGGGGGAAATAGSGARPIDRRWRLRVWLICTPGRRHKCLAQQPQQLLSGTPRVAPIVAKHQTDDEALVVVDRCSNCKGGGCQRLPGCTRRLGLGLQPFVRLVHPRVWFAAQPLELARQVFADLARAALDLAPVAGLNLQPFGESPFQAAQRCRVRALHGGGNEFIEQRECVIQTDTSKIVAHGGVVPQMIKQPCPGGQSVETQDSTFSRTSAGRSVNGQ